MNKKQRDKMLDGLMGLAYSFAAVSAGISIYEQNFEGYYRAGWAIVLMFVISMFYEED